VGPYDAGLFECRDDDGLIGHLKLKMERCASVDGMMDIQTPREGARGERKTKLHEGKGDVR
jgi:hypothetical protein